MLLAHGWPSAALAVHFWVPKLSQYAVKRLHSAPVGQSDAAPLPSGLNAVQLPPKQPSVGVSPASVVGCWHQPDAHSALATQPLLLAICPRNRPLPHAPTSVILPTSVPSQRALSR